MELDNEELYRRANDGDAHAQMELAVRLHNGIGMVRNIEDAALWVKRAAEGGNPHAQVQLAINLRGTKDPEKERESVEWLKRAVAQCDNRARMTLGAHLFLGIGTPIDEAKAWTLTAMASLGGDKDARSHVEKYANSLSPKIYEAMAQRLQWPYLHFIIGPPVMPGRRRMFDEFQTFDGEDSEWMRAENLEANETFLDDVGSGFFEPAYGCKIRIKSIHCAWTDMNDLRVTTVAIRGDNIVTESGLPILWPPDFKALDSIAAVMALVNGREWIRTYYLSS